MAEPGRPGQIGELLVGERRHHDPLAVRGGKVAGEAALPTAADPDVIPASGLRPDEEGKVAAHRAGGVRRCR